MRAFSVSVATMETFLAVLAAILALAFLVAWLRARMLARGMFERWRDAEIDRERQHAARIAHDEATVALKRWQAESESAIRRDAVARSGAAVLGKATETLAPYLPTFPYNPRDVRFLGSPVDLVVFEGLDEGAVRRIVFVEVKSGSGRLSTRERQVRDAVTAGEVEWEEWRLAP